MITALVWPDGQRFREHIEYLRSLGNTSHSDILSKADLLNRMPTLCALSPTGKTGDARHAVSAAEWSALIPQWKMALSRVSPN